ncbi:MAG: UbiA family prenyltransferase [Thermoplasmata archaeon]
MVHNIVEKFGDYVERFEDVPIYHCIAAIIFISTFRNILDMFGEGVPFNRDWLLAHISTGVAVLLILWVIYRLATKEKSEKVMGVLTAFLSVILLGPFVDMLIYGPREYRHTYMLSGMEGELVYRFFTFFGPVEDLGPNIGIRVSIFILMLLSFLYFYYKNENVIRSAFFTFVVYFVMFMGSSTLILMQRSAELLGVDYHPSTLFRVKYFLLWILLLLVINLYLMRKDYLIGILKEIRPFRLGHYILMIFFGMGVAHVVNPVEITQYSLTKIVFMLCSFVLAWLFAVFMDKLNSTDKQEPGIIPLDTCKIMTVSFFFLAIIYSYAGGSRVLFFILLFMGGSFFYSAPPFMVKNIPMISKLPVAVNSLLLLMLGHSLTGELLSIPAAVPIFFFTIFFLAAHFTDINSFHEDQEKELKTLPVLLGLKKAKIIIGAFFALAVFTSYFVMDAVVSLGATLSTLLLALLAAAGVLEFYLIYKDDYKESSVFLVYLILAFLLTYILFIL